MSNFTFTQKQLKRCHEHGAKWVVWHTFYKEFFVVSAVETSFSPLAILTAWATDLWRDLYGESNGMQVLFHSNYSSAAISYTGLPWARYDKRPTREENLIDMCCDLWGEKNPKLQPDPTTIYSVGCVVESVKRLDAEVQQLKKKVGL